MGGASDADSPQDGPTLSLSEPMAERQSSPGFDFFVSYAQEDQAWAEWIAWQLESADHSTLLQAWDFVPGSDWAYRMQQATAAATRTIAVLSSSYLESIYGGAEWRTAFANDPTGEEGLLLPVRVEPIQPPGLLRTRVYVDLVGLSRQAARARLLQAVDQPSRPQREPPFPASPPRQQPTTGQEPRFPRLGSGITNLPARNRNFAGRADVLEKLQTGFRAGSLPVTTATAIHGLGGVGKTQLVLEYAHWHAAEYQLVWWIPAQQTTTAVAALSALARQLGVQETADQGEMVAELLEKLRRRGGWLLIYDNAEAPEQLGPLLPLGGDGHVLITSRNPAWGRVAETLPLTVMRRHESVAFLRRRIGSQDEEQFAALAELLGDLPLALDEAAAYVEETQVDLTTYLQLVKKRAAELFHLQVTDAQRVATAWSVSLDRVRAQSPAAAALLDLCAFLAPEDIPRQLPCDHHNRLPPVLAHAAEDPLAYNEAIRPLTRFSLVTVTPTALGVHPLVQVVVRSRLGPNGERRWTRVAVSMLRESFPDRSWEAAAWRTCQRLLPHIHAATEHAERLEVAGEEVGWLHDRASAYLRARGLPPHRARSADERGPC
jgi:TIR domain